MPALKGHIKAIIARIAIISGINRRACFFFVRSRNAL